LNPPNPKAPTDPVIGFRQAMRDAGLEPPDVIEPGKLHRFPGVGKGNGNTAGWCKLFPDGLGGVFGDWAADISETWQAKRDKPLTPAEREAFRRQAEDARARAETERKVQQDDAARRAGELWLKASRAKRHPYLTAKKVSAHGIRQNGDSLLIPLFDADGALHSLQFIEPDGTKKFLPGGRVTGCFHLIGEPQGAGALLVCEGYATGASLHEATGMPVAVAFSAGNLKPVSLALRAEYPDMRLIVCADNDATEGNPGLAKATEAALAVGGLLAVPPVPGDFNDLHARDGVGAVRNAVEAASEPDGVLPQPEMKNAPASILTSQSWPDPQPLAAKIEREEYPQDALPDAIRAAVEEVQAFVKAPVALVASSALAALSLACQAHIDVKRAEKLHGPVGLFLLTIADSGERKSTCDNFFASAIRQYQEEQAEAMKPAVEEYQAAIAAWEAERDGILSAVKDAGKKGKPTDRLRADLAQLQQDKPDPPRVPRLILGDETPENLAWSLAKQWPSAGVLSSEAGVVFGGHAMGRDSIMRNLALLNVLWDGGTHSIGRRTSESFTVRGARLTMGLMVQETTLREYFSRSGGLARGMGFLARVLVAWPESTQGQRPFTEAPANWPHLAAFHRRIAAILNQPAPIDGDGALTPAMLTLTPDAKAAWVEFHNAIESELGSGGELHAVRDVASKSADNAARLAALFQVFEHGMGAIGVDSFERASRIVAWHLSEARRFFGELALPAELADAARLDAWLIEYCKRERTHLVQTREAQRLGPVRDKEKLTTALRELEELDRVRVTHEGRRKTIKVNPALVGVTP
jgi:putative DNA primase/helicase